MGEKRVRYSQAFSGPLTADDDIVKEGGDVRCEPQEAEADSFFWTALEDAEVMAGVFFANSTNFANSADLMAKYRSAADDRLPAGFVCV